jgi:hypothetical protein
MQNRFSLQLALAAASAVLLAVTVAWPDWIELAFHVDPDAGTGTLERALTAALCAVTVVFTTRARASWRARTG